MEKRWRNVLLVVLVSFLLSSCSGLGAGLPSAEALVARHIELAYPSGDISARQNISMEGRLLIDEYDLDAPISLKIKAPDRRLFAARVMDQDVLRSCSEGQCWSRELNAATLSLQGDELLFMQELADFYRLQNLQRYYRQIRTVGRDEFNGVPAYEVQLIRNNGNADRWYFGQESGLWLGGVWQLPRDMGGAQITQIFDEYRNFDGLYVPTKITEVSATQTSVMLIEQLNFKPVADSLFELEQY